MKLYLHEVLSKKKSIGKKRPLSNYELYVLNDKVPTHNIYFVHQLELSEGSDNEGEFKKQNVQLPFDHLTGENPRSSKHKQNRVALKKKSQGLAEKFKNQMNIRKCKRRSKYLSVLRKVILKNTIYVGDGSNKQKDSYIISPDGTWKLLWDLLCMALIFYEIMSIPFKLSFDVDVGEVWDRFVDSIFWMDILLSFNTAYYHKGVPIYNRKKIAINYLKCWFWLDLLASFPYTDVIEYSLVKDDTTNENYSDQERQARQIAATAKLLKYQVYFSFINERLLRFMRFIKVIRLIRLAKLKVIFDKIDEFLQVSTTIAAFLSFLQLSVLILFWSHWLGCIFHFIAINESGDNWLKSVGIEQEDWWIRYINSVYWAVTTMNTVGYGDISPQTPLERGFGIFFLLIACGVFSFTINTIGAALQQIDQKKQDYRKRMTNISNYMKRLKIPSNLQSRIRKYLAYIWDTDHPISHHLITGNLSQSLKQEFTIQVNGRILANCTFFCEMLSRAMLIEITQLLREVTILPDEFIFKEQDLEYQEKHLYFIQEGFVNIIMEQTKQVVAKLEKNDYFGEIAFFTNSHRSAAARSIQFTNLFYLDRELFLQILKKYPLDHQRFCEVRDDILIKNDYSALNIACYCCLKDDHVVKDCPVVHFVVDKQLFIKVKRKAAQMVMKQFVRRDNIYVNARGHKDYYQDQAKKLIISMEEEEHEGCDLIQTNNDVDEAQLDKIQNQIKSIGLIKSKFRQEKIQKRFIKRSLQQQRDQIERLEELQQYTLLMFNQLGTLLDGNEDALKQLRSTTNAYFEKQKTLAKAKTIQKKTKDKIVTLQKLESELDDESYSSSLIQQSITLSSSESEDIENDADLDQLIEQRLQYTIQQYNIQQQKVEEKINRYNENPEKQLVFMFVPNFDQGANFLYYQTQNNMSDVIYELEMILRQNQEFRARVNTNYEEDAFNDLIEFYEIDTKWFDQNQEIKKDRLKNFLSIQEKRINKLNRQSKKQKNLMKTVQSMKKMQTGVNIIRAINKFKFLLKKKQHQRSSSNPNDFSGSKLVSEYAEDRQPQDIQNLLGD